MKKLGFVMASLLLLVLPIFAQTIPQRGELIRATYGSGSQWIDVTPQVRSLIRGESLSFRVDNATLGVESRSGATKTLRLQFRNKNRRTQQLTFQQNQYVNVRVNSVASLDQMTTPTWGRTDTPDNGACFYRQGFDRDAFCLQTGQSLSSIPNGMNDQISAIKLFGNATATVFKDSGFGGERRTFSSNVADLRYGSGGDWSNRISSIRVDRASNTTADNGYGYRDGLQITRAIYGAGSRTWDVTNRLNPLIQNRELNVQVNNDSMAATRAPTRIRR